MAEAAALAAAAASAPSATSAASTSATWRGGRSTRTHRDATVTSSWGTWSATRTKTVLAGGSSIVFSSFGPTFAATRCMSWRTRTLRAPSTGERSASRMTSSTCSVDSDAPDGTKDVLSGC
jgi:hypothetical protein